ncbi:MAG: DUF58 domain-containing protein [Acidobacteria bacterium]|nr:DUF58 domain-containing protein [Acidobacteriota bacterium]
MTSASRHHIVAPAERSTLRDLELIARATAEGLRQGLHRSPFHGYSAEFSQYRHYRPGDDLKYVDWKAFGRTDRLYTRQFRETSNLDALFVVDVSRSMNFPAADSHERGSVRHERTKLALAQAAAAALATLVIDQGDTAGLLAVGDSTSFVPARSGRHHLHLLLASLARLTASAVTPVSTALKRVSVVAARRGLVVLLSDLYDDEAALGEVRRLSRMRHEVIVCHVLARAELHLRRVPAGEFVDLETGTRATVDPGAASATYEQAFATFLSRVTHSLAREGVDYVRLVTDEPIEAALRRFLVARRGRA